MASTDRAISAPDRVAAGIIAVAAAMCVARLLVNNLDVGSPVRAAGKSDWPARATARQFADADELFRRAAGGHNLQLAIARPAALDANSENLLTQLYFRAAFAVFPRRVWVGHDDRVINGWQQLASAATVPEASWMRSRDVMNVLQLSIAADGGLAAEVEPVR